MRVLPSVKATPEQLKLLGVSDSTVIIYGAAGSGKTTTALMRLRALVASWRSRRARLGQSESVRVLVLTYNRTLAGYIDNLAKEQIEAGSDLEVKIETFSKWAMSTVGPREIIDGQPLLRRLVTPLSAEPKYRDFLVEEATYVMERFLPEELDAYQRVRREGRGQSPRIDMRMRTLLLEEVIRPYIAAHRSTGTQDWNELAVEVSRCSPDGTWDIVVVDEAQDFTANQMRAVVAHLSNTHSMTCVLDSMQRIYHRYYSWKEVGVEAQNRTYRLESNHRNTKQIAAFAQPLLMGMNNDGAMGALPDFKSCFRDGELPIVLNGLFRHQLKYVLDSFLPTVDLANESLAFLHPFGGGYFDATREALRRRNLPWDELTRSSFWPSNDNAIALSTMHSAKGLEFDHVIMLGINQELTPHGEEEGDGQLNAIRRLIAMSVGRAKKSVVVGTKPGAESSIFQYLAAGTFVEVQV